ncbi:MAG: hypothetical protein HY308_10835 [Gammaproteobacteria bacterium]|nr:hypothetical protein [Gammaproteobacteria bacterium]
MIEMKDLVPITISIVALFGSIFSLYLSKFRPGKLHLTAGEHINIGHVHQGSATFVLAVNFANAGSQHLTVDRVALLIQYGGSPEGYLLEPNFYLAFADSGEFKRDSMAVPITVFGGENVTKQVQFGSSAERPIEFQMTKNGTYVVTLLAWLHGSNQPSMSESFSLVVSETHVATLATYINEKTFRTVMLTQSKWRNWDAHYCKANEVEGIVEHATSRSDRVAKKRE